MAAKLTRLTHRIAIQLAPSGKELYYFHFLLQAASPGTFGYTLVFISDVKTYLPLLLVREFICTIIGKIRIPNFI
jgi:hypothetical protein